MSLFTIAIRVADEVGLPRPASVATGTDQLARQMFALANAALEELATMNWPVLERQYSFSTVVSQQGYDAPSDFKRWVTDTAYVQSQYYAMRGSLTPHEWQIRRSTLASGTGKLRYRMMGDPLKVNLLPIPQTVENLVIEYVTSNWAKDTDGIPLPLYSSDSDVAIVPEELVRMGLKWRIKHAKGLDYSEDFNKFEVRRAETFAQQMNLGSVPVAQRSYADVPELGDGYVPEQGYG